MAIRPREHTGRGDPFRCRLDAPARPDQRSTESGRSGVSPSLRLVEHARPHPWGPRRAGTLRIHRAGRLDRRSRQRRSPRRVVLAERRAAPAREGIAVLHAGGHEFRDRLHSFGLPAGRAKRRRLPHHRTRHRLRSGRVRNQGRGRRNRGDRQTRRRHGAATTPRAARSRSRPLRQGCRTLDLDPRGDVELAADILDGGRSSISRPSPFSGFKGGARARQGASVRSRAAPPGARHTRSEDSPATPCRAYRSPCARAGNRSR